MNDPEPIPKQDRRDTFYPPPAPCAQKDARNASGQQPVAGNLIMLKNYLKVALPNIVTHKLFPFINIFGLALSLSLCLLVIVIINDAKHSRRNDGSALHRAALPFMNLQVN